jgi:hypothetical protein
MADRAKSSVDSDPVVGPGTGDAIPETAEAILSELTLLKRKIDEDLARIAVVTKVKAKYCKWCRVHFFWVLPSSFRYFRKCGNNELCLCDAVVISRSPHLSLYAHQTRASLIRRLWCLSLGAAQRHRQHCQPPCLLKKSTSKRTPRRFLVLSSH